MDQHIHQSHGEMIKRLKRAQGHLLKVIDMMQAQSDCADVAQQLHAVEKSITAAKKVLIHEHLDHCLGHAINGLPKATQQAVAQFKDMTKYL